MAKTSIEWATHSWNPIRARNIGTGLAGWYCEHVSDGCRHCYAETINKRLGTGLPYKPGHRQDVGIYLDEKALHEPRSWKKPKRIFVCSMTDLFADFVTDDMIASVFATMAVARHHTFIVLTKRPDRMRHFVTEVADGQAGLDDYLKLGTWPLPNVWLGTSAEDQETAADRLPHLVGTPAVVRFLSAEPLLGPIDLAAILADPGVLQWVIVGGESGHGARDFHLSWARDIIAQCRTANVAVFMKQLGTMAFDDISFKFHTARFRTSDRKGGTMSDWPAEFRVREMPL